MKKSPFLILAMVIALLTGSCSGPAVKDPNADAWEFNLNDAIPWTMRNAIKNNPIKMPLAMIVTDNKGQPLEKVQITVQLRSGNLQLSTDEGGMFTLPLDTALIAANPVIIIRKDGYKAGDFDLEVSGKTAVISYDDENFEVLNYRNLSAVNAGNFKVLYNPADKAVAEKYLDTFLLVNKHFSDITGLTDMDPIFPIITRSNSVTTVGEKPGLSMMPVNVSQWTSLYWFYTHENVESNVMQVFGKNNVYDQNEYLRWVGDGLAEYTPMKVLERVNPKYKNEMLENRIYSLKKHSDKTFKLNKWSIKGGHVVGYSYALAFWIDYEKKHGEAAIPAFISDFTKLQKFENENVYKLTGNPALELEKQQALAVLEAAKVK